MKENHVLSGSKPWQIPQGFVLWFKDGNIQNCELSN
ncbi:Uncharacterised protein [Avibacterium paragallinarum]|uniref:Uncharacterized protein n=1 Tax=Avibacterium paragallinarum TaxID=728 RepID=A0A380X7D8_AVIPA|nr:Uncharacterised protein [Avibacterium paragallinarum]